jgi:hypothetical protein
LSRIEIRFLSAVGLTIPAEHFAFPPESVCCGILDSLIPPLGWNSAIVPDFPNLFEDFKQRTFTLLWGGSRDGFGARDFHRRCDGHPNTLTVILDTNGNIFGGFTPMKWESDNWGIRKGDPSLKGFLFTLTNPHKVPLRRFVLKAEKKEYAIRCDSRWGPIFCDIVVCDTCNANTKSYSSHFGNRYVNDTRLVGKAFFTGSGNFEVKETEVFEITD